MCVGVCVCHTCFLQLRGKSKVFFFNIQYSTESKTSPTLRYNKDVALFYVLLRKEKTTDTSNYKMNHPIAEKVKCEKKKLPF